MNLLVFHPDVTIVAQLEITTSLSREQSVMIMRCATQMYLAMVWNRVDIAEEKIFSNRELVWKEGELDMVMIKPSS